MNLWPDECLAKECHIHDPEPTDPHHKLLWTQCKIGCDFHREQLEEAHKVDDYYHRTLSSNICRIADCPIHQAKKARTRKVTHEEEIPHINIHWSHCYDDRCLIHYSSKNDTGYFPKYKGKKQLKN